MTTPTPVTPQRASFPEVVAPLFIAVNLLVFAAYAVGFLVAPQALAAHFDIALNSTSALADFRAMYGGLSLGCALVFAAGLRNASLRPAAVMLAAFTSSGLVLGRLITIAVDGMPGTLVMLILATEVASAAVGLFLLTRTGAFPERLGGHTKNTLSTLRS